MTQPLVPLPIHPGQVWLELPGVEVQDLSRKASFNAAEVLKRRLHRGLAADPERRRPNFYEASIDGHRYYFHVFSCHRPKVFLLARWRERPASYASSTSPARVEKHRAW